MAILLVTLLFSIVGCVKLTSTISLVTSFFIYPVRSSMMPLVIPVLKGEAPLERYLLKLYGTNHKSKIRIKQTF